MALNLTKGLLLKLWPWMSDTFSISRFRISNIIFQSFYCNILFVKQGLKYDKPNTINNVFPMHNLFPMHCTQLMLGLVYIRCNNISPFLQFDSQEFISPTGEPLGIQGYICRWLGLFSVLGQITSYKVYNILTNLI